MTSTDNFEFDGGCYNFENTNEFLQSISGVASSLSPVSQDEIFNDPIIDRNWGTLQEKNGELANKEGDGISPQEIVNPGINYVAGGDDLFNEVMGGPNVLEQKQFQPTFMTNTSYSQDSTCNGMTPMSQNSVTSINTSPEPEVKMEDVEESKAMRPVNIKNAKITKPQKKDKSSHNMIEKKYRTNINSKIVALRDAVPSLRIAAGKDVSVAELEGLTPASKLNKASVLTKATEYIKHLESKNEALSQQNMQLQRSIQEASVHGQVAPAEQQQQQQPIVMQQGGFGYVPSQNEQRYNTTMAYQQFGNEPISYNSQNMNSIPDSNQNYNKYLLAGMTAFMGTSLLTGDGNDFKGLSALPFSSFFPHSLTHPSPLVLQFLSILKILLIICSAFSLILPNLLSPQQRQKGKLDNTAYHWLIDGLGFQFRSTIDEERIKIIILRLSGSQEGILSLGLLSDFIYLASSEPTFEHCFLYLIIGTMLIAKYPFLSKFINYSMNFKGSLLLNTEYKEDNQSLVSISKLICDLDGISMLGSNNLINRLINLAEKKGINSNIDDDPNHLKYIEFFTENSNDYYKTIFSWRILELTHQLNLAYLETIAFNDTDENFDDNMYSQIMKGIDAIESILLNVDSPSTEKYFNLFKTVIKPNTSAVKLLKSIEVDVTHSLSNLREVPDDQTLDRSVSSDSSTLTFSEEEIDDEELSTQSIKSQKARIEVLNSVTEEQFIILSSALTIYYYKYDRSKSYELLKHLRFSSGRVRLSLLSFTALLKVIIELVNNEVDLYDQLNSDVLNQLTRVARLWVNDDKVFLNYTLRGNLSDLIVSKGMILNGIETIDEENDD